MADDRERIVFTLEQQDQAKSALDEEREKHRQRAERFGTDYKDPAKLPKFTQEARRERFKREGFATGIDLFSEEELAKKAARAKKFGLAEDRQPLAYAPDPEDLKREARARKFGVDYKKPTADTLLQKADLFEPRKDAPEEVPRRETAIYLYGVDVMSTAECLAYFEDYGPTLVEWINDSSCCVVFEDAASTRRAIAGMGHPLTAEEQPTAPDGMDEHMMDVDPVLNMPYLWHKGRDFLKHNKGGRGKEKEVKVPLMYRMATDLDQKDPHAEKRSRYLWQGKRRFEDYKQGQQEGQQQRQQQRGRGHGRGRGAGRQQHRRQQYDEDGEVMEDVENGGGAAADGVEEQSGRKRRGRGRGRGRQTLNDEADVDMQDVEDDYQADHQPTVRYMEAAGSVAAGDALGIEDLDDAAAKALREQLKRQDAARRAAEEDLQYEEIPQPGDAAVEIS